jgi:pyridinium-3,5-bisthiocarboxylic acid mononucleotide nickel chelatase
MKTAYFDCIAGASGDMILGALIDAGLDAGSLRSELSNLDVIGWKLETKCIQKHGFSATKVDVIVDEQPPTRTLPEIERIISESQISESVKTQAITVIRMIGAEESLIHGLEMKNVHLHEIGGEDAIIDIVGCLIGIEKLGIKRIECSPLPLGRGFTKGAHGHIPLPAPATVALLKGVPVVGSEINAELVTPTGAALLKHLVNRFGSMPAMNIESIGYGAGTWDLSIPNLLRVFIGESEDATFESDVVSVLETNIDDQNPEHFEHIMDLLFAAGALDVTMTQIQMKKNRPGILLAVICNPQRASVLRHILLTETSSLGVREQELRRTLLERFSIEVETPYGKARVKIADLGNGQKKYAPEYADCRLLAKQCGVPLREVYSTAEAAARAQSSNH